MSKTSLQAKADVATGEAFRLAQESRETMLEAREMAAAAAKMQEKADREEWARVQIEELGVKPEDLDLERGLVRSLPVGPTYGPGGTGWGDRPELEEGSAVDG